MHESLLERDIFEVLLELLSNLLGQILDQARFVHNYRVGLLSLVGDEQLYLLLLGEHDG